MSNSDKLDEKRKLVVEGGDNDGMRIYSQSEFRLHHVGDDDEIWFIVSDPLVEEVEGILEGNNNILIKNLDKKKICIGVRSRKKKIKKVGEFVMEHEEPNKKLVYKKT